MTTVVACPACQQNVQVPPEYLDQDVRCPTCTSVFKATASAAAGTAAVRAGTPPPLPNDPVPMIDHVVVENVPAWEKRPEDELAKPLEEDEAPESDEGERRKRKKGRRDSSESGYYGELQRRQRKMQTPHRGVLVLTLGILSILFSPACLLAIGACACGWYAYQMGSHDLQEIYAGRMDRSGETLAKIGRVLGIVGICLSGPLILLNLCGLAGMLVRAAVGPVAG